MPYLLEEQEGLRLLVHIQPQAPKNEIVGLFNGRLKIKIKAPPVDGAANTELIRFLAKLLGLKQNALEITAGQTSRQKTVRLQAQNQESSADIRIKISALLES